MVSQITPEDVFFSHPSDPTSAKAPRAAQAAGGSVLNSNDGGRGPSQPQRMRLAPHQGACSQTFIRGNTVVQLRPPRHRIDVRVAAAARRVLGELVPTVPVLEGTVPRPVSAAGMEPWLVWPASWGDGEIIPHGGDEGGTNDDRDRWLVYTMSRMPGQPLSVVLEQHHVNSPREYGGIGPDNTPTLDIENLVRSLARDLFARPIGQHVHRGQLGEGRRIPLGRIGSSFRERVVQLGEELPARFRPIVNEVEPALDHIEQLPWVVTHGDLCPQNILVDLVENNDSRSGDAGSERVTVVLRGIVDWAEGEWLPFGVGLYGLETLLTCRHCRGDDDKMVIDYRPDADALRKAFWDELNAMLPWLCNKKKRQAVEYARLLGILLWHGFAFDDGALNRVVNEGDPRDEEELAKLDLFLLGKSRDQKDEMQGKDAAKRRGEREGEAKESAQTERTGVKL